MLHFRLDTHTRTLSLSLTLSLCVFVFPVVFLNYENHLLLPSTIISCYGWHLLQPPLVTTKSDIKTRIWISNPNLVLEPESKTYN